MFYENFWNGVSKFMFHKLSLSMILQRRFPGSFPSVPFPGSNLLNRFQAIRLHTISKCHTNFPRYLNNSFFKFELAKRAYGNNSVCNGYFHPWNVLETTFHAISNTHEEKKIFQLIDAEAEARKGPIRKFLATFPIAVNFLSVKFL